MGHYRNARIGTDATAGVTLNLDCRDRLGDAETRVTTTDIRANGDMPIRARGRYMQPELLIAAGTTWTFAESIDLEGSPGGRQ